MIEYINLAGVGVIIKDIPQDLSASLDIQINNIKENFECSTPYNNNLVGHIEKEFELTYNEDLDVFISSMIQSYNNKWPEYLDDLNLLAHDSPLGLYSSWVNFQKKYEFNPPHAHSGVFSFVIWIDIPYELEEELRYFKNVHQGSKTSLFNFIYTDGLGKLKLHEILVDKTYEKKICFFPANLMHYVNPFYTSNEFRISVSGNVKLLNNTI